MAPSFVCIDHKQESNIFKFVVFWNAENEEELQGMIPTCQFLEKNKFYYMKILINYMLLESIKHLLPHLTGVPESQQTHDRWDKSCFCIF